MGGPFHRSTGKRALDDLDQDIRDHIERETQDNLEKGMAPDEARRRAMLAFGNVALTKEDTRAVWVRRWADDVRQDVRYASRTLLKNPGFAAVVILTLALGIGANTAIFSLMETVLLRSLPVERPQELVFLQSAVAGRRAGAPPYPYFQRFRDAASSFAGMSAFADDELKVEVDGIVEQVFGQVASGNYFEVLGLRPAAGRLMTVDDERLDPPVAVIGYAYWQRRFGGASDAIGRSISFGNQVFTIVGVTPPEFWGLNPGYHVDVTLPITQERRMIANAEASWFNVIARLRPDISERQATVEANTIFQSFKNDGDRSGEGWISRVERLELAPASRGRDQLRTRFSKPLFALSLGAAIFLLVACTNLGILLLVRGATRGREFAVRLATGAGWGRLLRQLMTETLLLFMLGAAVALAVAYAAIQALKGFFAVGRRPILLDVQFDWTLVAYAAAVTLAVGLFTGLWPALRALRIEPQTAMKENEARLAGAGRLSTGRFLVAGQVALSLALLVAAAMFARTLASLRAVDLGFTRGGVVTMSLQPEIPPGTSPAAREQLWRRVLERVSGLPGVRGTSLSVLTPLSGRNTGTAVAAPGFPSLGEIRLNHVSEDYFRAFGIDLEAGRVFSQRDAAGALNVAVLNEAAAQALAKAYFGGQSPVGRTIQLGESAAYQVVGVVRDHKHLNAREQVPSFAFIPLWQPISPTPRLTLAIVSDLPETTLVRAVADEVRAIHPGTLISDVISIEQQIESTLVVERLLTNLATGFAVLVLVLAATGLYGLVSYSVASRRSDFGVRIAIGAPRLRVMFGVAREVLPQVAVGIGVGLPLALIAARAAQKLLFGVTPADPMSYALGAGALMLTTCAAVWLPARRACSIDPAETLRRG